MLAKEKLGFGVPFYFYNYITFCLTTFLEETDNLIEAKSISR